MKQLDSLICPFIASNPNALVLPSDLSFIFKISFHASFFLVAFTKTLLDKKKGIGGKRRSDP